MSCQSPLPFASLVDYWAGDLPEEEQARVEEHQFACATCAERLESIGELTRGIAAVAKRRGGFAFSLTASMVKKLEEHGLVMRYYRARPGDVVPCTVGPDDDLMVTWLDADFAGVERVDLALYNEAGQLQFRNEDVPVDHGTNQVIYTLAGDLLRKALHHGPEKVRVELISVDAQGERVLGQYIFAHVPWPG
jgi:hypothetical protein